MQYYENIYKQKVAIKYTEKYPIKNCKNVQKYANIGKNAEVCKKYTLYTKVPVKYKWNDIKYAIL